MSALRTHMCAMGVAKNSNEKKLEKRPMHFHSRECYQSSMKNGLAKEYVKSQMTDEVKNQIKTTMFERYGVHAAFHIGNARKKARQTCLERYGSNSSMGDPVVRRKKEQTFIERYGVRAPISQCALIVSRSIETQIERYGDIYTRTQGWRNDVREWSLKTFGTDHPMHSNEYKKRFDFKASWKKQHTTKKLNGTYAASKIERRFGGELIKKFGQENVDFQVIVNGWSIDFYVKSIDTYVQFDGVYWHGLDRPVDDLRKSTYDRDKRIVESYDKDRKQDVWFSDRGLRLIRITDREYKENPMKAIKRVTKGNK